MNVRRPGEPKFGQSRRAEFRVNPEHGPISTTFRFNASNLARRTTVKVGVYGPGNQLIENGELLTDDDGYIEWHWTATPGLRTGTYAFFVEGWGGKAFELTR